MTKICKNCSFNNPDTANYCGKCGLALRSSKKLVPEDVYNAGKDVIRDLETKVSWLKSKIEQLKNKESSQKETIDLTMEMNNDLGGKVKSAKRHIKQLEEEIEDFRERINESWFMKFIARDDDESEMLLLVIAFFFVGVCIFIYFGIKEIYTSFNREILIEATCSSDGKWGLYDHDADSMVVACQYDSINILGDSYWLYSGGEVTVADKNGIITADSQVDTARKPD